MKINELMIGDWVSYKKVCSRIAPADFDLNHRTWIQEIEPIPLTTEILEKNGFVWDDLPINQYWEQYGLIIYPAAGGYRMNCGQNVSFKIDSVHELQHLFRLCGIDKDIEL